MPSDLTLLLPVLTVTLTALVILVADWFLPDDDPRPSAWLALVGLGAAGLTLAGAWFGADALVFTYTLAGVAGQAAGALGQAGGAAGQAAGAAQVAELGWLWRDHYGTFASAILVLSAFLTVLLSYDYVRRRAALGRSEYYVLLLLATAAMMLVVMANDLILIFLSIETFSIALYVLAGFLRGERPSQEAALKYFVLGAFAAGFLLYGIALAYAATGTTNLVAMGAVLAAQSQSLPAMIYVALGMILVGLGFKIAMAPFHQWTPDVYQGAPLTVTGFMAAGTKTAAFAALARVLWVGFAPLADVWVPLLGALAVVTMFAGNLAALVQADLKRMLAYSAVAHAGYLLVAVVAGPATGGTSAMLFYLAVYAVTNLGTFGALAAIGPVGPGGRDACELDDLRGLARRHAALAFALALFLLSLTGLPPTAGFLGKWYIFQASVDAQQVWLAILMVLNSMLSAFYYLRPVVVMTTVDPGETAPIHVPPASALTVAGTALVVALAIVLAAPFAQSVAGVLMAGGGG